MSDSLRPPLNRSTPANGAAGPGARKAHVAGGLVPPRSVGLDPVGKGASCWCLRASASFVSVSFWSRWKGKKEEEERGAVSAVHCPPGALQGDIACEAWGARQLLPCPTAGGSSNPAVAAPLPCGPLLRKRASRGATITTESSLAPSSVREPEPPPWLAGGSLGQSRPQPSVSVGGAAAPGHVHPTPADGSHA